MYALHCTPELDANGGESLGDEETSRRDYARTHTRTPTHGAPTHPFWDVLIEFGHGRWCPLVYGVFTADGGLLLDGAGSRLLGLLLVFDHAPLDNLRHGHRLGDGLAATDQHDMVHLRLRWEVGGEGRRGGGEEGTRRALK